LLNMPRKRQHTIIGDFYFCKKKYCKISTPTNTPEKKTPSQTIIVYRIENTLKLVTSP
jgi:hypothetical protein